MTLVGSSVGGVTTTTEMSRRTPEVLMTGVFISTRVSDQARTGSRGYFPCGKRRQHNAQWWALIVSILH